MSAAVGAETTAAPAAPPTTEADVNAALDADALVEAVVLAEHCGNVERRIAARSAVRLALREAREEGWRAGIEEAAKLVQGGFVLVAREWSFDRKRCALADAIRALSGPGAAPCVCSRVAGDATNCPIHPARPT